MNLHHRKHIEHTLEAAAAFIGGRNEKHVQLGVQGPLHSNEKVGRSHKPTSSVGSSHVATRSQNERFSVEAHLEKTDANCREIFLELKKRTLALHPGVTERAVKLLVGYKAKHNFSEIHFLRNQLKIHLRPIHYIDPNGLVEHVHNAGFTMDRRVYISDPRDIEYVITLIKQSYADVPLLS